MSCIFQQVNAKEQNAAIETAWLHNRRLPELLTWPACTHLDHQEVKITVKNY